MTIIHLMKNNNSTTILDHLLVLSTFFTQPGSRILDYDTQAPLIPSSHTTNSGDLFKHKTDQDKTHTQTCVDDLHSNNK